MNMPIAVPWRLRVGSLCIAAACVLGSGVGRGTVAAQEDFTLGDVIRPQEFNLDLGVGRADYREEVSIAPVESRWDAVVVQGAGEWIAGQRDPWLFRLQGGFWATDSSEERWTEAGSLVQRNDMDASGAELGADAGWAALQTERGLLRAWGGVEYRNQRFERSNFRSILGPAPGFGAVGESYDLLLVRTEMEGRIELVPAFFLEAGGLLGYAVYTRADNDLLGSIESEGGWVAESRLDLRWQVSEKHAVSAGMRFGVQNLDGDTKRSSPEPDGQGNLFQSIVEWPDNQLDMTLFAFRWSYSF